MPKAQSLKPKTDFEFLGIELLQFLNSAYLQIGFRLWALGFLIEFLQQGNIVNSAFFRYEIGDKKFSSHHG